MKNTKIEERMQLKEEQDKMKKEIGIKSIRLRQQNGFGLHVIIIAAEEVCASLVIVFCLKGT